MTPLDKSSNNSFNVLEKDSTFQNDQSVTFSLNTIKDSHDGGQPEYQSEPGNFLAEYLREDYTLLGSIYGQDNEIYLFSTNGILSEIGIFKEGSYRSAVNANLKFNTNYPITGEYRIRKNCNRTIYWSDHFNNDRWFDFDEPDLFKTTNVFDPNKFNFNPDVNMPFIDLVSVNETGGNLQVGSYYFQLELLDESQSIITKTDISPQTIVYGDSPNIDYHRINGDVNTPQFDQLAGGILPTTKSINLLFSNLDIRFKYLRVNIAYQTTNNGVISAHQVGQLLPITSTSINYTYTGFNVNSGDIPLDYSSMLISPITYNSSYVMEQVQNRLVRANLKSKVRDYDNYQTITNLISSSWVASESNSFIVSLGNPKDPNTYWYKTNFQGDEIHAFGIRYLHKDGTYSPVFHIAGRSVLPTDNQLLTVVNNNAVLGVNDVWLSDVEHLNLVIGNTVEKWKVFNTSTTTTSNTVAHPYNYEGEFGYYHADFNYPTTKDCEGNFIFGDLNDTPVRFHRFPDRKLIKHINGSKGEYIVQLGIKFNVPAYPNSDVIGHQFCQIPRDDFNRTITDSGWGVSVADQIDVTDGLPKIDLYGRYAPNGYDVYTRFESPDILFNKKLQPVSYLKHNFIQQISSNLIPQVSTVQFTTVNNNTVYSAIAYIENVYYGQPTRSNYKTVRQIFSQGNTITDRNLFNGVKIVNYDALVDDSVIETSFAFENIDTVFPIINDPQVLLVDNETRYSQNNVYIYKKVNNNIYQNFLNLTYKYLNHNPIIGIGVSELYRGDSIIVNNSHLRLGIYNAYILNQGDNTDTFFETLYNDSRWVESQINTDLRYEGFETGMTYFTRTLDNDLDVMLHFFTYDSVADRLTIRLWNDWIPEYFKYNSDYNLKYRSNFKFNLPFDFDYCSRCEGIYSNRIVFSPKSFDEENVDLYKQLLVNDYIDIPGHRGAITGLDYRGNQLLVHCEDSTFILQPNPQVIATDQINAYLSTGDFLSIPPVELLQTDLGYAGCQNKQHQVNTPYGRCWIDQRRGEVFKFSSQLEKITNGLNQWFKENLPSEIQKDMWLKTKTKYPFTNTTSNLGIGCILYYDPRFKRLLLSKIDYQPLRKTSDELSFNTLTNKWQTTLEPIFYPELNNCVFFENKSWTLSFGFDYNGWVSWHSYIPYNAFSDDFNFYTLDKSDNNAIYKHLDKSNYQNYYCKKYDMILEFMSFDLSSDRLFAIHYQGYCYQWSKEHKEWMENNKTFDRFVSYNKTQSTGLQNLLVQEPYSNITLPADTKFVIRRNQDYKIAGIYDMSIGQPVTTSSWDLLKDENGYIDKVPYNIDFTKNQYEWSDLWDKYIITRLFFKPQEDYKKIVILSQINEQISQ